MAPSKKQKVKSGKQSEMHLVRFMLALDTYFSRTCECSTRLRRQRLCTVEAAEVCVESWEALVR